MKDLRPQITAQRLLNLYRQYKVINGRWAALNPVFLAEGSEQVLEELQKLATGGRLAQHIRNLKSGKTPNDSINPDLLPYGGMMEFVGGAKLEESDMSALTRELRDWRPDLAHLDSIRALPFIKNMGDEWHTRIAAALANYADLSAAWDNVVKFDTASNLWLKAEQVLASVPTERLSAEVQADMLGYENYLPMFGAAGTEMLDRLKRLLTSQEGL